MLTDAEKDACRHATFLKGQGHGYGSPEEGLCPIGAVAVLRGAVPRLLEGHEEYTFLEPQGDRGEPTVFWHTPSRRALLIAGKHHQIAEEATIDVLQWTGHRSMTAYLSDLETRGTHIFDDLQ